MVGLGSDCGGGDRLSFVVTGLVPVSLGYQ